MALIKSAEVIVIGGGLAGLSAAIYLARAKRDVLVIDDGESMARWEPEIQNYLGFPNGIAGPDLLERGRNQARKYEARFARDRILWARRKNSCFRLKGEKGFYRCERLLLATGIFHIPPDIPGVNPCLGHSMFFCKDCDGYRIQGKAVAVYGWSNEAVRYALGLLLYSPCVAIVTDGREPRWDEIHARRIREYEIAVHRQTIIHVDHQRSQIEAVLFDDQSRLKIDALFTTRGDIYFNEIARRLGARVNPDGEILVDLDLRTSVPGLYAAGCVTPANCQMIIAAGQGAIAAQTINSDLLEQSLATHSLRRFRRRQLRRQGVRTRPRHEKVAAVPSGIPARRKRR